MRAFILNEHGGLDAMALDQNYPARAGPDDVVLGVRACALNYHDIFTRNGMPGIKVPLPMIRSDRSRQRRAARGNI